MLSATLCLVPGMVEGSGIKYTELKFQPYAHIESENCPRTSRYFCLVDQ